MKQFTKNRGNIYVIIAEIIIQVTHNAQKHKPENKMNKRINKEFMELYSSCISKPQIIDFYSKLLH